MITVSDHSAQALKLLIELHQRDPDLVPIADAIARRDLGEAAMITVLPRLRRNNLIRSKRGINGGYQLARPAADITVAEIVEAVDGPLPGDLDDGPLKDAAVAIKAALAVATVADCSTSEQAADAPSPMYYI